MPEPISQPSDADLAARVRAGDERVLSRLYDEHAERLYSMAMAMLRDPGDAEEVVADAFLRLWRADDFDPSRGSVGAYLAVVTRSRALDRLRSRDRRGRAEKRSAAADPTGFSLPVAEAADEPEARVEAGERRTRVVAALAALSDKQRAVVDLAYFGGLTHREIAERLSEPLGTVKTRLRDGMKKLRDALHLHATGAP